MSLLQKKIVAVYRSADYSPNLADADALILQSVANKLQCEGAIVALMAEDEFLSSSINCSLILSMSRSEAALKKMQMLSDNGILVINSAQSIKNCTRLNIHKISEGKGIYLPKYTLLETSATENIEQKNLIYPLWLKLPEAPAVSKDDICFVVTEEDLIEALNNFANRGVKNILAEEHLQGDLVKFYSVAGTKFIHTSYPTLSGYSKFGCEEHNDPIKNIPFSIDLLYEMSQKLALMTGLRIFGGDCIISPQGEPYLIDFNDWPSFSVCREEASLAIVEMIKNDLNKHERETTPTE
ncbi:MAG: hypothetical protein J6L02_07670 [Bacteroidales bacterium]|nr:hypothetical protein [Bacteroidales bacterium]